MRRRARRGHATVARENISRQAVIWQLLAFVAVVLPHLFWLPYWIGLVAVGSLVARVLIHRGIWSFPHWSLKAVMVLGSGAGLLFSFDRNSSLEGMTALLVLALSLKLLEIYRRRDALVLLYVALFVAASTFLTAQEMLMAVYVLAASVLVLAALGSVWQSPESRSWLRPLRQVLKLVLPAVPLMLVLFVLFPRIGPLWSVQLDRSAATTGLSESMAPGDVSQLTRSAAVAFRAVFEGEPPAPAQRYWRALVYSHFDGRAWRLSDAPTRTPESLQVQGEVLTYEVVQEPSQRHWLFALDMPLEAGSGQQMLRERVLRSAAEIRQRRQYSLQAATHYQLGVDLNDRDAIFYTRLPSQGNTRSRALAAQWWDASGGDGRRFIEQMHAHFNRSFIYTLQPPPLGRESVDEFMFNTQRGFCEHFAGASAFMLRSVGIPARVVGGYQGGEWNAAQRYLTVRQYDAHAWVEAWLPEQGWVRIDPTAAVAPERIEMSADELFADQPGYLEDAPLLNRMITRGSWVWQAQRQYDALNFGWQRWVLNFHHRQDALLRDWLGEQSALKLALVLLLPVLTLLLGVLFWLWRGLRGGQSDPLERAFNRLFAQLARRGMARAPSETLAAYVKRVQREHQALEAYPQFVQALQQLAKLDTQRRYAPQGEHLRTTCLLQVNRVLVQVKRLPNGVL